MIYTPSFDRGYTPAGMETRWVQSCTPGLQVVCAFTWSSEMKFGAREREQQYATHRTLTGRDSKLANERKLDTDASPNMLQAATPDTARDTRKNATVLTNSPSDCLWWYWMRWRGALLLLEGTKNVLSQYSGRNLARLVVAALVLRRWYCPF